MSAQPASHDVDAEKVSLYDLYQAVHKRCRRLFLPGPSLKPFPFPMEIVYLIVEHLASVDRLRLSLTCKLFYREFFPQTLQLSRDETEDVLLSLERDVARVYYCDHCVKLHPWKPSWVYDYRCGRNCYNSTKISFGSFDLSIPYSRARLVMNRHFYGKSHGLPVSALNRTDCPPNSYSVGVSRRSRMRIINDELYLHRRTRAKHSFGCEPALRKYLSGESFKVCRHLYFGAKMGSGKGDGKVRIPYGHEGGMIGFEKSGRCGKCQTEYEIWMTKHFVTGWNLYVYTYSRIGRCRSTQDPVWVHMEGRDCDVESLPEFGAGEMSIKDRWLASEEEEGGKSVT